MAADVTVSPTLGHAVLMTQGGVGASPGYDAIDLRRMIQAASGGQEGTYDATGWKVSENAGGANMTVQVAANVGLARVDGESVTNQGPYVVAPHSAIVTLDVAAAHSTNPRIDLVILHVRDNTHDALGANDARVRILSGTATSGATLVNLNGQASLPINSLRLADVLVPATDTTISNAQIQDRRSHVDEGRVGAFGAYRVGAVSLVTAAAIVFDSEDSDIGDNSGWFDTATGRFTPLVAGIYRLSWRVMAGSSPGADIHWSSALAKNGGAIKFGNTGHQRATAAFIASVGTALVKANGSTDYFTVLTAHGVGAAHPLQTGSDSTFFQGELVSRLAA